MQPFFGALHATSTLEFPLDEAVFKILSRTALGGVFGTLGAAFAMMMIDFLKDMKVQNDIDSNYEYFDDSNVTTIHC